MISDRGLAFIADFEGCRTEAYPDPGTGNQPYTIGFGHTGGVRPSDICSLADAKIWLEQDCNKAWQYIDDHVDVELNQNQKDALISFVFNCGEHNFRASTMLTLLNQGNYGAAASQFTRWNRANGAVMPGLTRRRKAEAELFMEPMA